MISFNKIFFDSILIIKLLGIHTLGNKIFLYLYTLEESIIWSIGWWAGAFILKNNIFKCNNGKIWMLQTYDSFSIIRYRNSYQNNKKSSHWNKMGILILRKTYSLILNQLIWFFYSSKTYSPIRMEKKKYYNDFNKLNWNLTM